MHIYIYIIWQRGLGWTIAHNTGLQHSRARDPR